MNSPLVWLAIVFSLGIWISSIIRIPVLFLVIASLFSISFSVITIRRKAASFLCLSATFFLLGCLLLRINGIYPPGHIRNFTTKEPEEVYLEGIILNEPQLSRAFYGEPKTVFTMQALRLQREGIKHEVSGKVKAVLSGVVQDATLNYGDRILVKGFLSVPARASNPGEFDYGKYLERNGIFSSLNAKGQNTAILQRGEGSGIVRAAYQVRGKIKELIASNLPEDSANFLIAILLGLRQDLGNELNDTFMKTGTVHLLAISGLNVGLLVFLIMLLLKIARVPQKINIIATICFLFFYAVLTNGTASVVRATVMSIVVLSGLLIGRQAPLWNSLGLAALIILGFDPNAFFDIGFQLSFASVAAVLYITPMIEKLFRYDRKLSVPFMSKWKRYLLEATFVSLAAWIGIAPLILYYFNIATPVSILANLFAIPLSFLITAASIPFIAFGFIAPFIGKIFAAAIWFLCAALFAANDICSKIPLAYLYFPKPPFYLILLYYAFLIAFFESRRFKIPAARISLAALLIVNIIIWSNALKPGSGELKATFLDVGHGDSVFLEFPGGGNMLIDGGSGGDWDTGRNVILPFLRNKGVRVIDAVLLTHPDSDHVGGLASVLEGIKVRKIFDNGVEYDTGAYMNFRDAAYKSKIIRYALKRGDLIEGLKGVDVLCLNPPAEWAGDPAIEENDKSLAIKVQYGQAGMLFCGDIGEKAISEVITFAPLVKSRLLMLPHHGERLTPVREAFIDTVNAGCAVISQGKNVGEVERSKRSQELISAKGIRVFRTSDAGAVFAVTDGKSLFVHSFKSPG